MQIGYGGGWAYSPEWKRMTPFVDQLGYQRVSIRPQHGPKRLWPRVHTLVLEAFVGRRPKGHVVCHFPDPDPHNNRLENLQWGTHAENLAHQKIQPGPTLRQRHLMRAALAKQRTLVTQQP